MCLTGGAACGDFGAIRLKRHRERPRPWSIIADRGCPPPSGADRRWSRGCCGGAGGPADRFAEAAGLRHELGPAVSVLVAARRAARQPAGGRAGGGGLGPGAAGGARLPGSPGDRRRVAPSARTLYRIPAMLDADEFEAALAGALADAALDPAVPAAYAARRRSSSASRSRSGRSGSRRRGILPGGKGGRLVPAAPAAPLARPRRMRGSRHVPARQASPSTARSARAPRPRKKKVHLLAAVTHTPGIVIGQDKVPSPGRRMRSATSSPCWARCRWPGPSSRRTRCRRTGTTPCSCGRSRTRTGCGPSWATSRT